MLPKPTTATATIGFELGLVFPSKTARRASANTRPDAAPQVVTEAKGNMAGFVLANGSMSSNQSGEGDIRRDLIEADLVDCMVTLPGQLFYSTRIHVKEFNSYCFHSCN